MLLGRNLPDKASTVCPTRAHLRESTWVQPAPDQTLQGLWRTDEPATEACLHKLAEAVLVRSSQNAQGETFWHVHDAQLEFLRCGHSCFFLCSCTCSACAASGSLKTRTQSAYI